MGRVQGGARAAFATPSWDPARMSSTLKLQSKKRKLGFKPNFYYLWRHA